MLELIPTIIIAVACFLIGRNSRLVAHPQPKHHKVFIDTLKWVSDALDKHTGSSVKKVIDEVIHRDDCDKAVHEAQKIIDK